MPEPGLSLRARFGYKLRNHNRLSFHARLNPHAYLAKVD
jgi:hypothetical protein